MYNEVKTNMLDRDCDCEYVISEAGRAFTPFVYIRMYLGDIDFSAVEIRAVYSGGEEWVLPHVEGVTGLTAGWYMTRLDYSDFSKTGGYEIEVRVYYNGEYYGVKVLYFYHNNLQSSGEWNVCKVHGGRNSYLVQQVSTTSSGGGGGGGGGSGATYTAGDGIDINEAYAISAKIGNGLKFEYEQNEDGTDNTTKPRKIAVKIGEGLAILDDGTLISVPNIQNAVILQEAEASYLLHEYTEVEYIAGNTIGYAGPTSKIVCQGYVFDSLTPDKYTLGADVLYGTSLNIRLATSAKGVPSNADVHIDAEYDASDTSKAHCYLVCSAANYRSAVGYYYDGVFGIYFKWDSIHAPNDNFPYGYVKGKAMMPGKAAKNATNFYNASQLCFTAYFPFASEAEYNAAVGLTYEPITLTEVQETVTEA